MANYEKWHYIGIGAQEIGDIVDGIGRPEPDDKEGFRSSKVYSRLTPGQLSKSENAYLVGNNWSVLVPSSSGEITLWDEDYRVKPMPLVKESNKNITGLILSGAYGEFVERDLERRERQTIYEILGIPKDLDTQRRLMLVGGVTYAIAFSSGYSAFSGVSTADVCEEGVIKEDGMRTEYFVGADMSGDFRTVERALAEIGYVTPQGDRVPFGPTKETMIPFFYGVEIDIIRSALTHLIRQGYDIGQIQEEIFEFIEKTKRNPSEKIANGRDFFANYGDNSDIANLIIAHNGINFAIETHKKDEDALLLTSLPFAQYGDRRTNSQVISSPNGLQMKTISVEGESVVTIPNQVIPMFIAALCSQDFGRTDSGSMKLFLRMASMSDEEIKDLRRSDR